MANSRDIYLEAAIAELEQDMVGDEEMDAVKQEMVDLANEGLIVPKVKNDQLVRREG